VRRGGIAHPHPSPPAMVAGRRRRRERWSAPARVHVWTSASAHGRRPCRSPRDRAGPEPIYPQEAADASSIHAFHLLAPALLAATFTSSLRGPAVLQPPAPRVTPPPRSRIGGDLEVAAPQQRSGGGAAGGSPVSSSAGPGVAASIRSPSPSRAGSKVTCRSTAGARSFAGLRSDGRALQSEGERRRRHR